MDTHTKQTCDSHILKNFECTHMTSGIHGKNFKTRTSYQLTKKTYFKKEIPLSYKIKPYITLIKTEVLSASQGLSMNKACE